MEQLAFRVALFQKIEEETAVAATGYVDLEALAIADIDADFASLMAAGIDGDRDALGSVLDGGNVRASVDPYMLQIGKTINSTSEDPEEIFLDLYDEMITNADSVNSRGQTYGTPVAGGGNVGNGPGCMAEELPWDGRPFSIPITLPPLGCVVMKPRR